MRFLALLFALSVLAGPAGAEGPDLDAAREPIETLYTALLGAMKGGDGMGLEGRRAHVAPAVDAAYDVGFMASKALGRHWRGLEDEQRSAWIETFRQLTINTYASRFKSFSGQAFEVVDVQIHQLFAVLFDLDDLFAQQVLDLFAVLWRGPTDEGKLGQISREANAAADHDVGLGTGAPEPFTAARGKVVEFHDLPLT